MSAEGAAKPGSRAGPRYRQGVLMVAGHHRPAVTAAEDFRPEMPASARPTVVAACSEPKTNLMTGPMLGATDGPMK
jgi:hypothetical protein